MFLLLLLRVFTTKEQQERGKDFEESFVSFVESGSFFFFFFLLFPLIF